MFITVIGTFCMDEMLPIVSYFLTGSAHVFTIRLLINVDFPLCLNYTRFSSTIIRFKLICCYTKCLLKDILMFYRGGSPKIGKKYDFLA
jgi:hypothetical protein